MIQVGDWVKVLNPGLHFLVVGSLVRVVAVRRNGTFKVIGVSRYKNREIYQDVVRGEIGEV